MKRIFMLSILIIFSFIGGFAMPRTDNTPSGKNSTVDSNYETYSLLAKRLFIEDPNEPIVAFAPLRKKLNEVLVEQKTNGSIYFEYLPTGTSIRIGTEEKRIAASLIKLPFSMEAYYARDHRYIDFDKKITLTENMINTEFGTLYEKGSGYEISLSDAINLMIRDSDNTALNAVASILEGIVPAEEGPFNFLDAEFVQNDDLTVSLTPRAYSSFLKCLYFSCYLTKDSSQELLRKLSETNLNDRLPAGLPQGTLIAHKVGNYYDQTQSDCGIIYVPKKNYLLCVMLDSVDSPATDSLIAEISRIAYEYVSKY